MSELCVPAPPTALPPLTPTGERHAAPRRRAYADANDWLNAMVGHRLAIAQRSGQPLSAEVAWVADHHAQIYQRRLKPLVWAALGLIVAGFFLAPGLLPLLVTFVALYFYVDFYSGVLHVVLDNPHFCRLPLLGVPCVEFQWHHTFVYDISTRKLTDVWGDLNTLLVVKSVFLFGLLGLSRQTLMVAGVGYFWAYTNQYAHRLAHASAQQRPPWARWLQAHRLLVPPSVHHEHHVRHDTSFPVLSGRSRRLIDRLLRWFPQPSLWLGGFLLMTAFDLVLFALLLEQLPF